MGWCMMTTMFLLKTEHKNTWPKKGSPIESQLTSIANNQGNHSLKTWLIHSCSSTLNYLPLPLKAFKQP